MRILIVNKFVHLTGGADRHCLGLAAILRARGHDVAFLSTASESNVEEAGEFVDPTVTHWSRDALPTRARGRAALNALWNPEAAAAMRRLISSFRPDLVHAHKLYPQLSVSPIFEASRAGVPVVQTLHDFELVSASALDARGGWLDLDESRISYRLLNSATFPVRRRLHVPRVRRFVSVSRFLARVAASHGVASTVVANFGPPPDSGLPQFAERHGILFLGRLRREKGVLDVVEVARRLPAVPVTIAGDGVLAGEVEEHARRLPNLRLAGFVSGGAAQALVRSARVMVVPSRCYEAGPLVSLEAMSHGTPSVVYPSGGLAEYVADAGAGLVVPADPESLARAAAELHEHEELWEGMSSRGSEAARSTHSPDRYGERIEQVYEQAVSAAKPIARERRRM